jgi:flagellin
MVSLFGGLPPVPTSNLAERVRTQKSLGDLASGKRIDSAADNPAVLALNVDLDAELSGARQASRNTFSALAVARTAEGGMDGINQALVKLKELTVQAGSSTLSADAKAAIQVEFDKTVETLDMLASSTEFNGTPLLDGSAGTLAFQVGTGAGTEDQISLETANLSAAALSLDGASVASVAQAGAAGQAVDQAMEVVAEAQASVGATTNQLEAAVESTQGAIVNTSAGLSQRVDTDMASTSADLASSLVMQEMGISLQVQANATQFSVLQLLG